MSEMGPAPLVLVVDDEPDLVRLVAHGLEEAGYRTRVARSVDEARALLALGSPSGVALPDLVVLDVMLPDVAGTVLCRELRQHPRTARLPILLLTARGSELDRVVGFELGADDYVTKPFSLRELVLRVGALLRRALPPAPPERRLALGPIELDLDAHDARLDGAPLALTPIELRLLEFFATRPGTLCSRELLLEKVWGYAPGVTTRTVDTHVKRLREKLGAARELIETVRGAGYRAQKS